MRDIENYTAAYVADGFETKYQASYRRKKVLEILHQYPHRRILEIGCGMDSLAGHLSDFDAYTIVEPSREFAEHAGRSLGSSANVEILPDFFENQVKALGTHDFDFVIVSSLLHEVEHPEAFLTCLSKVVGEETVIHINVPNANSFHKVLAVESGLLADVHELSQQNVRLQQHIVFDMQSLQMLIRDTMERNDREVEFLDTGGINIKPFTHRQMEMCLMHGIFDERVLDGLYRMVKYLPELASEIYVNFRVRNPGGERI